MPANPLTSTPGWSSPPTSSPRPLPPVRWGTPASAGVAGAPSSRVASAGRGLGPPTDTIRLLLIEDNLGDVDLLREHLEDSSLDAELLVACRLADGLELLDLHDVDCVLLDLHLPDARGEASVRELRERAAEVPVVVLTGLAQSDLAHLCVHLGAQEYLEKHRLGPRSLTQAIRLAMLRVSEARSRRELVHTDRLRAVGMLAAGIAHEVNNPLTYLQVNLGQLEERVAAGEHDAELARLVSECRDGVHRIAGIIQRLNTFARADEGRHTEVHLDRIVHDARRLTEHHWRQHAHYEEQLGPTPPLLANAGELTQVVVNLLVNAAFAVKAGGGGVIRVRTRDVGGAVEVIVSDDGQGMTTRELRRAFDPFYTTKPREHGSGLGLALCRQIAQQHGGSLTATSTPGAGAEVTLRLPVRAPPQPAPPSAERAAPAGGTRRVLVIDDEPNICRAMTRLLGSRHEVTTAGGGLAAIELLGRGADFDVVLCDLTMPDADGREVHEWIERNRPELLPRFVLMSGGAQADVLESLPPARRLAKPFRPGEVFALIDEVGAESDP